MDSSNERRREWGESDDLNDGHDNQAEDVNSSISDPSAPPVHEPNENNLTQRESEDLEVHETISEHDSPTEANETVYSNEVTTFLEFTGTTSRNVAMQFIVSTGGDVEEAVNLFLSGVNPSDLDAMVMSNDSELTSMERFIDAFVSSNWSSGNTVRELNIDFSNPSSAGEGTVSNSSAQTDNNHSYSADAVVAINPSADEISQMRLQDFARRLGAVELHSGTEFSSTPLQPNIVRVGQTQRAEDADRAASSLFETSASRRSEFLMHVVNRVLNTETGDALGDIDSAAPFDIEEHMAHLLHEVESDPEKIVEIGNLLLRGEEVVQFFLKNNLVQTLSRLLGNGPHGINDATPIRILQVLEVLCRLHMYGISSTLHTCRYWFIPPRRSTSVYNRRHNRSQYIDHFINNIIKQNKVEQLDQLWMQGKFEPAWRDKKYESEMLSISLHNACSIEMLKKLVDPVFGCRANVSPERDRVGKLEIPLALAAKAGNVSAKTIVYDSEIDCDVNETADNQLTLENVREVWSYRATEILLDYGACVSDLFDKPQSNGKLLDVTSIPSWEKFTDSAKQLIEQEVRGTRESARLKFISRFNKTLHIDSVYSFYQKFMPDIFTGLLNSLNKTSGIPAVYRTLEILNLIILNINSFSETFQKRTGYRSMLAFLLGYNKSLLSKDMIYIFKSILINHGHDYTINKLVFKMLVGILQTAESCSEATIAQQFSLNLCRYGLFSNVCSIIDEIGEFPSAVISCETERDIFQRAEKNSVLLYGREIKKFVRFQVVDVMKHDEMILTGKHPFADSISRLLCSGDETGLRMLAKLLLIQDLDILSPHMFSFENNSQNRLVGITAFEFENSGIVTGLREFLLLSQDSVKKLLSLLPPPVSNLQRLFVPEQNQLKEHSTNTMFIPLVEVRMDNKIVINETEEQFHLDQSTPEFGLVNDIQNDDKNNIENNSLYKLISLIQSAISKRVPAAFPVLFHIMNHENNAFSPNFKHQMANIKDLVSPIKLELQSLDNLNNEFNKKRSHTFTVLPLTPAKELELQILRSDVVRNSDYVDFCRSIVGCVIQFRPKYARISLEQSLPSEMAPNIVELSDSIVGSKSHQSTAVFKIRSPLRSPKSGTGVKPLSSTPEVKRMSCFETGVIVGYDETTGVHILKIVNDDQLEASTAFFDDSLTINKQPLFESGRDKAIVLLLHEYVIKERVFKGSNMHSRQPEFCAEKFSSLNSVIEHNYVFSPEFKVGEIVAIWQGYDPAFLCSSTPLEDISVSTPKYDIRHNPQRPNFPKAVAELTEQKPFSLPSYEPQWLTGTITAIKRVSIDVTDTETESEPLFVYEVEYFSRSNADMNVIRVNDYVLLKTQPLLATSGTGDSSILSTGTINNKDMLTNIPLKRVVAIRSQFLITTEGTIATVENVVKVNPDSKRLASNRHVNVATENSSLLLSKKHVVGPLNIRSAAPVADSKGEIEWKGEHMSKESNIHVSRLSRLKDVYTINQKHVFSVYIKPIKSESPFNFNKHLLTSYSSAFSDTEAINTGGIEEYQDLSTRIVDQAINGINQKFRVHQRVEARYAGRSRWYRGRIVRVNAGNTFDVSYDDGDTERNVPADLILAFDPSNQKHLGNEHEFRKVFPGAAGRLLFDVLRAEDPVLRHEYNFVTRGFLHQPDFYHRFAETMKVEGRGVFARFQTCDQAIHLYHRIKQISPRDLGLEMPLQVFIEISYNERMPNIVSDEILAAFERSKQTLLSKVNASGLEGKLCAYVQKIEKETYPGERVQILVEYDSVHQQNETSSRAPTVSKKEVMWVPATVLQKQIVSSENRYVCVLDNGTTLYDVPESHVSLGTKISKNMFKFSSLEREALFESGKEIASPVRRNTRITASVGRHRGIARDEVRTVAHVVENQNVSEVSISSRRPTSERFPFALRSIVSSSYSAVSSTNPIEADSVLADANAYAVNLDLSLNLSSSYDAQGSSSHDFPLNSDIAIEPNSEVNTFSITQGAEEIDLVRLNPALATPPRQRERNRSDSLDTNKPINLPGPVLLTRKFTAFGESTAYKHIHINTPRSGQLSLHHQNSESGTLGRSPGNAFSIRTTSLSNEFVDQHEVTSSDNFIHRNRLEQQFVLDIGEDKLKSKSHVVDTITVTPPRIGVCFYLDTGKNSFKKLLPVSADAAGNMSILQFLFELQNCSRLSALNTKHNPTDGELYMLWEDNYKLFYEIKVDFEDHQVSSNSFNVENAFSKPDLLPSKSIDEGVKSLLYGCSDVRTGSCSSMHIDTVLHSALFCLKYLHHELVNGEFKNKVEDGTTKSSNAISSIFEKSLPWRNARMSRQLSHQIADVLAVCTRCFPSWIDSFPGYFSFMFKTKEKEVHFRSTSLGVSRAIHALQNNLNGYKGKQKKLAQVMMEISSLFNGNPDMIQYERLQESSDKLEDEIKQIEKDNFIGKLNEDLVKVTREHLLHDAESLMSQHKKSRSELVVQFMNEHSSGSGVTVDFYSSVAVELQRRDLNNEVPMWVDENRYNSVSTQDLSSDSVQLQENKDSLQMSSKENHIMQQLGLFPQPLAPLIVESKSNFTSDQQNTYETLASRNRKVLRKFRFLGRLMAKAFLDQQHVPLPLANEFFIAVKKRFQEVNSVTNMQTTNLLLPIGSAELIEGDNKVGGYDLGNGIVLSLFKLKQNGEMNKVDEALEMLDLRFIDFSQPRPFFKNTTSEVKMEQDSNASLDPFRYLEEAKLDEGERHSETEELCLPINYEMQAVLDDYVMKCSLAGMTQSKIEAHLLNNNVGKVKVFKALKASQQIRTQILASKVENLQVASQEDDDPNPFSLIHNGSKIKVTSDNLEHYLNVLTEWWLRNGIIRQIDMFLKGMKDVLNEEGLVSIMNNFSAIELKRLLCGKEKIQWKENEPLLGFLVPMGGYTESTPLIKQLVSVLKLMNMKERSLFLSFVTGQPRVPLSGLPSIKVYPPISEYLIGVIVEVPRTLYSLLRPGSSTKSTNKGNEMLAFVSGDKVRNRYGTEVTIDTYSETERKILFKEKLKLSGQTSFAVGQSITVTKTKGYSNKAKDIQLVINEVVTMPSAVQCPPYLRPKASTCAKILYLPVGYSDETHLMRIFNEAFEDARLGGIHD